MKDEKAKKLSNKQKAKLYVAYMKKRRMYESPFMKWYLEMTKNDY